MLPRIQRNWIARTLLVKIQNGTDTWKIVWQFLEILNRQLSILSSSWSPGHLSQRNEDIRLLKKKHNNPYTGVYSSFIHNSNKLETTFNG